jgi:hypothetical protein
VWVLTNESVTVVGVFNFAAALANFLVARKCIVRSKQRRTPPRPVLRVLTVPLWAMIQSVASVA